MASLTTRFLNRTFTAHPKFKTLFPSPSSLVLQTRSRLYSSNVLNNCPRTTTLNGTVAPRLLRAAGIFGIGLGLSSFLPKVHCDSPQVASPATSPTVPPEYPPPPASSVSLYELSFGTVTGICAGVFIKKGAKAAAWFLGGIFVLLQYLGSASLVRVDWGRMATKFENMFHTTDTIGVKKPPTVVSLWSWLVNFLTADFQPRASFLAGLVLGLRIG